MTALDVLLGEATIQNFMQAIVTDTARVNADFHYKAGLNPKIVRKASKGCCDWCKSLEGTYNYEDVYETGNDVWRRHTGCHCTVTYDPGTGKVQNVWDKSWRELGTEKKIEERKAVGIEETLPEKLVMRESVGLDEISQVRKDLNKDDVYYNEVKALKEPLSEKEIIKRVSGEDDTHGSCSSLAFTYIGNKSGYDVLDFRGGKSREIFANSFNLNEIARLPGVNGIVVNETNDFVAAKKLLAHVEEGKEYYFGLGRHAAIIRKSESGYEWLELQVKENAPARFNPLEKLTLKGRFGAVEEYKNDEGITCKAYSQLIECESLGKSEEFRKLLGYINTSKA